MLFLDVNVCVHALRPAESADAERVRAWVQTKLVGPRPVGLSEQVLASMIRIVTNPRVFAEATTPRDAIAFADSLLAAPSAVVVRPGSRHWRVFTGLVRDHRLRANDVPDAYYASLAIEHGATMVTRDRDFCRYQELQVIDPLAELT